MIKYGSKKILWLGAFLVFLIDQCTKVWALNFLPHDHDVLINHLFSLHRIFNDSYIMMNYNVLEIGWGLKSMFQFNIFYALVSLLLCVAIIWVTNQPALKEESWTAEFSKTGLFFIFGGILGNAFDRIFRADGVIDFVRVKYLEEFDFIFNFADLAIFMGEFCLATAWILILLSLASNKLPNFNNTKKQSLD